MKKRQHRNSISVRPEVYERLRRFCAARGLSVSRFVELCSTVQMNVAGEPEISRAELLAERTDQRQHAAVVRLGLTLEAP